VDTDAHPQHRQINIDQLTVKPVHCRLHVEGALNTPMGRGLDGLVNRFKKSQDGIADKIDDDAPVFLDQWDDG